MVNSSARGSLAKQRRELIHARLVAQHLAGSKFSRPEQALGAFGAMQGQDFSGLVSSIALRLDVEPVPTPTVPEPSTQRESAPAPGSAAADPRVRRVYEAFNSGAIVRGYPMRGTVFGLAAVDARWITELCAKPKEWEAPARRRGLGLSDAMVDSALDIAHRVLAEHPVGLSRAALLEHFDAGGVSTASGRGYHLITYFIARGELIYGAFNGKDNNVALAHEWLPRNSGLEDRFNGDRIAATAELLHRYLVSHGPASLRDFAWWTKLTLREIRAAFALIEGSVETWSENDAGEGLYCRPGLREHLNEHAAEARGTFLLPAFDEVVLGYPDRLALMTEEQHVKLVPGNNGVFMKSMIRNGQAIGMWKNPKKGSARVLCAEPFAPLGPTIQSDIARVHAAFPHHDAK